MEKVRYWINELISNKKDCKGFCPTCEYYRECSQDINPEIEYKKISDGFLEIWEDGIKIAEFMTVEVARENAFPKNKIA